MNKTWVSSLLTIGAAAVMAVPILAHHSGAMFEKEKTVTVEGVVKEFQYTNPHSWLLVDVKNKNGTVTTWGFEGEGPSTLQRSGIPSLFRLAASLVTCVSCVDRCPGTRACSKVEPAMRPRVHEMAEQVAA